MSVTVETMPFIKHSTNLIGGSMKKKLLFSLLLIYAFSFSISAQAQRSALETYDKWKKVAAERFSGKIPTHYALSVTTQRTGKNEVKLQVVAVGRMDGYTIEVQPVKLEEVNEAPETRTSAGELARARQSIPASERSLDGRTELNLIVSAYDIANAIEVKWVPTGATRTIAPTLILPLSEELSANVFVVYANESSTTKTAMPEAKFAKTSYAQQRSNVVLSRVIMSVAVSLVLVVNRAWEIRLTILGARSLVAKDVLFRADV